MKKKLIYLIIATLFLGSITIIHLSCKKEDGSFDSISLKVSLPHLTLKHDLYYSINYKVRSIEIEFNLPVNEASITGNIILSDKSGSQSSDYELVVYGRKVLIAFHEYFQLKHGWLYYLNISTGVKAQSGQSLNHDETFELRTTAKPIHDQSGYSLPGDSTQRNSIACISDIHMGDSRATNDHYCWFGKNAPALEAFLDFVIDGGQIRKLVIMGDLFDEWLVPYTISPIDPQAGIHDTREYFLAVESNPVNINIFNKLKDIALHDSIELIYISGNHDMLGTEDIIKEIIPNITWIDGATGLGKYLLFDRMVLEHGHRYDFFNCPQPLVNDGHMLPPGYFVSRLYAQGMMDSYSVYKDERGIEGSFEFLAAWEIAYLYTILHFEMTPPDLNAQNVLMGGINSYADAFSFNGARDMYAANIEDFWPATQTGNRVQVPTPCCFHAIWNGHSDLFTAAQTEYMKKPPAPKIYKIVAFGHTHEPMLKVYPTSGTYTSVYANSGSWIDADQSSHKVRTFLVINPAEWTGSDIDIVKLYQYNLDSDGGNPGHVYKPVLQAEENIKAN